MSNIPTNKRDHAVTDQEEYLDYKGLCALLKVSYGTVRNWKSNGKISYTAFNGKTLFSRKAILKNLRKNTVRSTDGMLEEMSDKI